MRNSFNEELKELDASGKLPFASWVDPRIAILKRMWINIISTELNLPEEYGENSNVDIDVQNISFSMKV